MTRRQWMRAVPGALLPFTAGARRQVDGLHRPPCLRPGQRVALVTPGTPVLDPTALDEAEATVRHFDLEPVRGANVGVRPRTPSEYVRMRLDDLHAAFDDPSIAAVLPVTGGYGCQQLLDHLDYERIARQPKLFVGYSDITALHVALGRHARLVTLLGPVLLSAFTPYTRVLYRRALFDPAPFGAIGNPPESDPLRPRWRARTIRPGIARGRVVGGNLTLLAASLGTPYEVDARGCILILEDVREEAYPVDAKLTQLRLAGKLRDAAGIVWAECAGCGPRDYRPTRATIFTMGEIVDELLASAGVPCCAGLTFGHTDDQATLPLGVEATLDATRGVLTYDQAATSAPVIGGR